MKDTPMKEMAPKWAEKGFKVFPVEPNKKKPCGHLVRHGVKNATSDPQKVRDWWRAVPSANIGVATGQIFVVDLDVKNEADGVANWKRLCVDHDTAPRTSVARTPSGGLHLFYRAPEGVRIKNSTSAIADGVDVRGHGGYVVAPPSRTPEGSYEWEDTSSGIADAPYWLLSMVRKDESQDHGDVTPQANGEIPEEAQQGQRNNFLTRWGGRLRRHGATAEELVKMLEAVNEKRCTPPLDTREVQQIARSVARYKPEDPVLVNGIAEDDDGDESPAFKRFPLDTLPKTVGDYVRASAAALGDEISPALVAVPTLSVLSAGVGNAAHLRLKRSWKEPATLWTVIVAPSGSTKSPAFAHAVRPIFRRESKAREVYKNELNNWKEQDEPDEREKPIRARYRTGDANPEGIVKVLDKNPRGESVLLARDELGAWIGSFDRYVNGAADLQFWVEVWQGIQASKDRAGEGNTTVDRPVVPVTGTIQPNVLKRKLGEVHFESGFAARLILCQPPARPKRWTEADVSRDVQDSYENLLTGLYDTPRGSILSLTSDAKKRWVDYFDDANASLEGRTEGPARAVAAKGITHTARLALIIHLARVACGESHADDVDQDSMEAAITLGSWLTDETLRVYDALGLDSESVPPFQRFLQALPQEFRTSEAKDVAARDDIPERTCEKWLRDLVDSGSLEKIKRGVYRKT